VTKARKKASLPRYDARRGWVGGDTRTLYTFTADRTGAVGVYPGGGSGKKLLMHWGPEANVRIATRPEAEEHWQRPLHAGWNVQEGSAHATKREYGPKAAEKVEKTLHEWKRRTLRSGGGGKVTSREQAIAIGLAQARRAGGKVPPRPHHATMRWKPGLSIDDLVRAYLSKMRPGTEIDARGIARAIGGVDPIAAEYALESAEQAGLAATTDGRWYGPGRSAVHHATRKSPAQLDKEIAEFMAKPKLGDPAWEREWSGLLTEKHSKARMPTVDEIARAVRYVEHEYTLADGGMDMEQLAEGLAFGRYAGDADDKRWARDLFNQVSAANWLRAAERANYLAREQGEAPRYVA
jgi:hypothetical protein